MNYLFKTKLTSNYVYVCMCVQIPFRINILKKKIYIFTKMKQKNHVFYFEYVHLLQTIK